MPNWSPEVWATVGAFLLGLIGGGTAAFLAGYGVGKRAARAELSLARERLQHLYAPMTALFTTHHVSTVRSPKYPWLKQRLPRAWRTLLQGHVVLAIKATWDKGWTQPRESCEVEYGGCFPLDSIRKILKGKEHLADATLLGLVAAADRAAYEGGNSETADVAGVMAPEEFDLFDHITDQHGELSQLFTASPR